MTYVVIENTPGYLPEDDDPFVTDDLAAAREYLAELVERHCEHLCATQDWRPDYVPVVQWDDDGETLYALVSDPSREHDLGRVFEVVVDGG